MIKLNRRQALILGGAAATTALAAPAIAQNTKIKVGALRFTSHSGSFVAKDRGYFADAGLDVELEFFQAAQPMAVAIASGDIDYAVTAISGGLISLAQKGAIKVIGGALIEEEGIDGQQILASDAAYQAGVTSPAMLDGKAYGVTQTGSSFHYVGDKIAQAEGISMSFKPLQKVGAVIGAIKSGQIDAWNIVPHIAKPLAGSGAVHIIGAVQDYLPGYQTTTVFTSTDNAENQRDKTEAFLAGFSKGVTDYNSTMIDMADGEAGVDEMVKLIHQYVYADRPFEKAKPSIVNGTMRINEGAKLNMASVQDQLEWFKAGDYVDQGVTIEDLVNTSYVETMS
ncbi:ABC transporter substrate-binding protein [Pseudooceanicola atlanticus]|jgi:NitT/TauT family transport system substrate-binding protein|uniref:ABC transporter substrate-binding protein n=1 Tax=Pseudooceanicola atlanticus TaxID=1461694 RepID=A0A0A0EFX2_9RHOB|nr:ABC transporter substrate-binding protein [Pseudooceanicola atlanticus]KGM49220.1 ABC transporter substrate-binding protein [Pseudooceanicola atlanticus]